MSHSSAGRRYAEQQVDRVQPVGKEKLVGTWKLVSCVGHLLDGQITYPYGPNPAGVLVYDADNNFNAQIQAPGRPLFESGNLLKGSMEEIKAAFEGYVAYYGTYEVEEGAGNLTHHVQGSLFPNWIGVDQTRQFEVSDNKLSLTTSPFVGKRSQLTLTVVWERSG
jgi:hypothetical protein